MGDKLTKQDYRNVSYRDDIQGLRAIAVIIVVLFHSKLLFPSGFLGVDLFFVISGFVITSVLLKRGSEYSRKDLAGFYSKRILRLLPALGTVIFFTSVLSFFLLSPLGMQQNTAKTGIGALLLLGNWTISKVTLGYFSLPANTNPLLHTWSLSVEEQFYLFFPIILYGLFYIQRKFKYPRIVIHALLLIMLLSFSLYVFQIESLNLKGFSWLTGYYSPLTRTWEFLLGSIIFLVRDNFSRIVEGRFSAKIANLFLTSILVGAMFPENTFKFPSIFIVFPLISIAFLILVGTDNQNQKGFGLSHRTLIYIGDRSYSIYLWHWPFIVFSRYLFPNKIVPQLALLLISIGCALLSYKYIEKPLRNIKNINKYLLMKVVAVFLLIPIFSSFTLGYMASEVMFKRYESNEVKGHLVGDVGAIGFNNFARQFPSSCKADLSGSTPEVLNCDIDVLLIGDSHARHLVPGFVSNFPKVKFAAIDPFLVTSFGTSISTALLGQLIANPQIKLIIFSSFWAQNGVSDNLDNVISILVDNGKQVSLLDDTPNFPFDAFTCKFGLSTFLQHSHCSMPKDYFSSERRTYFPLLSAAIKNKSQSELINISSLYCDDQECSMVLNSELHFMDMNHLNTLGSIKVADRFMKKSRFFCELFQEELSEICAKPKSAN